MSATIDERVVEMKFDNSDFEKNVQTSMSTLDKLKQALKMDNAKDSIESISKATRGLDFSGAASGIETLKDRFSTLGIVGMTVIQNLTDKAMNFAWSFATKIPSMITQGGWNRAMNVENARFQLQGLISDAKEVELVMQNAKDSVDGTAYAYDSAAKAASMFAASGLKGGEQMTGALRAVAGVAATVNADYDSIANIFTTVAGNGRLMGDQLNQLSYRGMNAAASISKYFNDVNSGAVKATDSVTAAIKELTDGYEIGEADLRDMVSKGAISFEIFSEAMSTTFGDHAKDANKTFNGALSNIRAALARTGEAFVKDLIVQEGPAVQLFNNIRIKINEMNKALADFASGTSKTINQFILRLSWFVAKIPMDQITKIFVNGFKTIANVFSGIGSYIVPVLEAFKIAFGFNINPLVEFSEKLVNLTAQFKATYKETNTLRTTFLSIFNVVESLVKLFTAFAKPIIDLIKPVKDMNRDFSTVFGTIYSKLTYFNNTVLRTKETQEKFAEAGKEVANTLKKIYDKISPYIPTFEDVANAFNLFITVIKNGIGSIQEFVTTSEDMQRIFKSLKSIATKVGDKIVEIFEKIKESITGINTRSIDDLTKSLGFLEKPLNIIKRIGGNIIKFIADLLDRIDKTAGMDLSGFISLKDVLEKLEVPINFLKNVGLAVFEKFKQIVEPFGKALKNMAGYIWDILSSTNPLEMLVALINTKIIGGIGKGIYGLIRLIDKTLVNTFIASVSSLIAEISGLVGGFKQLGEFSSAIKGIAEAMLMFAAAMLIVASIPAGDLTKATIAMTFMLTELAGAFYILKQKAGGESQTGKMVANLKNGIFEKESWSSLTTELLAIAGSILILAGACKLLATMDLESLAKGFGAVSAFLWELVAVSLVLENSGANKGFKGAGGALLGMAAAIFIITKSVSIFGEMDIDKLGKGILAVAALLAALTGFVKLSSGAEHMVAIGVGLLATAGAINIISKSVVMLSTLDVDEAAQGVLAIGSILIALGGFVKLAGNTKNMVALGLGMIEVAAALYIISNAIKSLADIEVDSLFASVIALSVLLGEIAGVLEFIKPSDAVAGLAAIEVAGSLVVIATALSKLKDIDTETLLQSMSALFILLAEIPLVLRLIKPTDAISALSTIEVAAALLIIAKSLKELDGISLESILQSTIVLSAILLEIAAALAIVPVWAPVTALAFVEVAVAMFIAAKALEALKDIDTKSLLAAVVALGVILLEMGGVATLMGLVAPEALTGALVIFSLAAVLAASAEVLLPAVEEFISAIEKYAEIDADDFEKGITRIGEVLVTLGESLKSFNILSKNSANALKTSAEALLTLAPAIMAFSIIDGEKLKDTFTNVAEGISKLGKALNSYSLLDTKRSKALVTLAEAIKIMAPALTLLSFTNPDSLGASMEKLGQGFEGFGKALKKYALLDAVKAQAIAILAKAISVLAPSLTLLTFLDQDKIAQVMTTIGEGFKVFGEALDSTPFWSPENRSEAIVNLTEGVKALGEALPALTALDQDKIASVMSTIGTSFSSFSEALSNTPFWGPENRSEAIVNLTEGIKSLSDSLPALTELDQEKLSSVMGTIGDAFYAFSEALSNTTFWAPNNKSEAINNLTTGVKLLAETLPALTELDQEKMASALSSIGTAFKDFSEALSNTPFWGPENRGNAIKILVGSIKELTDGLKYFIDAKMDPASLATSIVTISSAFKQFGESLNSAPFWGVEDKGQAVATLSRSVKALASGLEYFIEHVDGDKVHDAIFQIKTAFVEFGNALKGTPWFNAEDRADSIVTLVKSVKSLAYGISKFVELSGEGGPEAMANILSQVGTSLKDFGAAIKETPFWGTQKRTEALVNLMNNLTLIADVCRELKSVGSADEVKSLMTSLSEGIKALGESVKEFKGVKDSYIDNLKSLCNVANTYISIDTLAFSASIEQFSKLFDMITLLSTINVATLSTITAALSSFASNVTQTSSVISVFINTMVINLQNGVTQITAIGTNLATAFFTGFMNQSMIAVIGTSLRICNLLATNLRAYSSFLLSVGQEHGTAYITGFAGVVLVQAMLVASTLVLGIIAELKMQGIMFRMAGEENGQNYVKGFTENLLRGLVLVQSTITMMLMTLKIMTIQFKTIGSDYAHGIITGSLTTIQKEFVLINNSILAILNKLNAYSSKFMIVGKSFTLSVFNGALMQFYAELPKVDNMIYRTIDALNAMTIKFRAIGQGYATNIIAAFSEMSEGFRVAGSNAAVGFVNGVYSRVGDARNAGYALGQAAYEAARRALDENSPSKKMGEVGSYAGLGFVNALSKYISESEDVGTEMGLSVTESLSDSIARNIDLDMFNPVVKPVMDLSEIDEGANLVDSMFGTYKTMGLVSDISFGDVSKQSMTDLMNSMLTNSSNENTQVVESIESLRTDLNALSRVVGNLRVVMDTGTLVGAIAPTMDNALGQMAAYHERGMA